MAISSSSAQSVVPPPAFSGYQKFVIAVLAFVQFTVVLDFMILAPLGALLMRDLDVTPSQFGLVVSAYAFSAGISGFLTAGFADRFDRKRLLLFFYAGFVLGTLACALAPNFHLLLLARMLTGLFGGVMSSISFAIIADLFPLEGRGRVMGIVQTAFSASQVLGIPVSLYLSNHWGWHVPFLAIVAFSTVVGLVVALRLRPIDAHLAIQKPGSAFARVTATLSRPLYLRAFAATMLLVTGGFMVMPFTSAFTVNNVGISLHQLPILYMVTGGASIVAGPLIGRLVDRHGKYPVFCVGSVLSILTLLAYTNLEVTPFGWVLLINTLLMLGISSRMIAASALTSAVPDPADRGAFMSVNSSMQQLAGGVASAVAGMIVAQGPGGRIEHMSRLGYVAAAAMVAVIFLLGSVNRHVMARARAQAAPAPVLPVT